MRENKPGNLICTPPVYCEMIAQMICEPAGCVPFVGITVPGDGREPWIEPARLARDLSGQALVIVFETEKAERILSAALPPGMGVEGGHVRLWKFGLAADADPESHPLFRIDSAVDAAQVHDRIVQAVRENQPLLQRESRIRSARPVESEGTEDDDAQE